MGLTVMQINIQNFKKNKYLLSIEIAAQQPDIILVNELGVATPTQLKLLGYRGTWINNVEYDGVAIYTKFNLKVEHVYFKLNDILV